MEWKQFDTTLRLEPGVYAIKVFVKGHVAVNELWPDVPDTTNVMFATWGEHRSHWPISHTDDSITFAREWYFTSLDGNKISGEVTHYCELPKD